MNNSSSNCLWKHHKSLSALHQYRLVIIILHVFKLNQVQAAFETIVKADGIEEVEQKRENAGGLRSGPSDVPCMARALIPVQNLGKESQATQGCDSDDTTVASQIRRKKYK
jgi:hypothetical protein